MLHTPRAFLGIPILKRLIPSLLRRYARLTKHRYCVEQRLGVPMLLDQRNLIDKNLLVRGVWESAQLDYLGQGADALCRGAGKPAVFLDIGAHWGLYAILMRRTGLFQRILAFEPEPTNFAQLQGNLFVNDAVHAIEAYQYAVSDRDGEVLVEAGPDFNRGRTLVSLKASGEPSEQQGIPCRRLDGLLALQDACLVAKIDVEGHELEVLQGMAELLANNRCLLQIEAFGDHAGKAAALLGERYRHLKQIGDDHYFGNF